MRPKAIEAVRSEVAGPRRLRAIGFYALLCQLANEQRHTGEHHRLRFTYDELAARGAIARRNVKMMLDYLERAGVVRCGRLVDPERGATISILHLLIQDGPWTAITVNVADQLASKRTSGHFLRDIGLTIVLLEFCVAQRNHLDGLRTEVSRNEIANQAGITVDRVDQCVRLLQAAGLLRITRRRPANGGRNLPNLYIIQEAPLTPDKGGETELAGPQTGTGRAANRNWQGRRPELAGRQTGTGRATKRNWEGGISAIPPPETRPSYARVGWAVQEKAIEHTPTPSLDERGGGRGRSSLLMVSASRLLMLGSRSSVALPLLSTQPSASNGLQLRLDCLSGIAANVSDGRWSRCWLTRLSGRGR